MQVSCNYIQFSIIKLTAKSITLSVFDLIIKFKVNR